ncbi:uncharacterized protein M6D78_010277 [Vipera latastei]
MKPLGEIQYADDTQLFFSTPNQPSDALAVMSRCLEAVQVWMGRNRLRLNPAKTEWLCIPASRVNQTILSLTMGGEVLPPVDRARNLGVLLDSRLNFEDHIGSVTRGAFAQVCLVRQLRPYLDRDALRTVTHVLVTSRLDYCNALYMGLPLRTTRRLQLVQNAAAQVVMGVSRYSHVTSLLRERHWLPVALQMRFKVLVMTYKALNLEVKEDPLQGCAEEFSQHLLDKIARIRTSLDSNWAESDDENMDSLVDVIWEEFDPVTLDEVERIMRKLSSTTSLLDPCPSWLVYSARDGTRGWIHAVVTASLKEGSFPAALKEVVSRRLN